MRFHEIAEYNHPPFEIEGRLMVHPEIIKRFKYSFYVAMNTAYGTKLNPTKVSGLKAKHFIFVNIANENPVKCKVKEVIDGVYRITTARSLDSLFMIAGDELREEYFFTPELF